jgi:hypothetical protein
VQLLLPPGSEEGPVHWDDGEMGGLCSTLLA